MNLNLTKMPFGLIPSDPESDEWTRKLKPGQVIHGKFSKVRNYQLMRKYFALLNVGFDWWSPPDTISKFGPIEKNFERFRADVIILAGHYHTVFRLDGSFRVEPDSISFAKMSAEDFSDLYSKTIDVLLKNVYGKDMTAEELNGIVEKYLSFA